MSGTAVIGLLLGIVWAIHAAGMNFPGFVRLGILLVFSFSLIMWRLRSDSAPIRFPQSAGLNLALGCWFVAATLSAILNWRTDQVLVTYCIVFASGFAAYVALSGLKLQSGDIDLAIAGLAIGSLFPLVNGLLAFVAEWGVPDLPTALSAYRELMRMSRYEAVTFGNRGNTAAFLVILAPVLLTILFDRRKRASLRALCGITMVPVVLNLAILQVRAAFIVLTIALAFIWILKLGFKWLPVFAVASAMAFLLVADFAPEIASILSDQMMPVITVDAEADVSVQERMSAIREGAKIAQDNWLLGIGPGAALTVHSHDSAHQFQVQQAMETGVLGLFASTLFSIVTLMSLLRTFRARRDEENNLRFLLLVGPACYVLYAILANATLGFGSVNTWTIVVVSMLALVPKGDRHRRVVPVRRAPIVNVHFKPELCQ
jgi:hypothetical protein